MGQRRLKHEIRSAKPETNSNDQNPNDPNKKKPNDQYTEFLNDSERSEHQRDRAPIEFAGGELAPRPKAGVLAGEFDFFNPL